MAPSTTDRETHPRTGPAQSPLRSMTGFGAATGQHATGQHESLVLTVMLRSVNHRHFDLRVHLPDWLLPLETRVRSVVQARDARGHIELRVSVEAQNGAGIRVDEALVARYLDTFARLGAQHGLPAQADVATLMQLPGVVTKQDVSAAMELTPAFEAAFLETIERAVAGWDQMRAQEAAVLAADLRTRLKRMEEIVARIEQGKPDVLRLAQTRLIDRLQALAAQAGIDPARLAQEASLLADRTDVSEELLRLKAHVAHFGELLESAADAGRKLDFLLQEMNRETNTLLSKIAGLGEASLEMTRQGLDAKAEIEKLREQIQNLQ